MPLLTTTVIQSLKPCANHYRLKDGGGLYLEVRVSGAKFWRYRYKIDGRENIFTIGRFCPTDPNTHVSVDAARLAHAQARALVKKGVHPTQHRNAKERERSDRTTFRTIAEEWLLKKASSRTEQYSRQIRHVMMTDVFPFIGTCPVNDIASKQILDILTKVEARGAHSYAVLIRQWIGSIYRYAMATMRAEKDPTPALRGAIVRRPVKHSRALSPNELAAFLKALDHYRGDPSTIFGLQLMLLTFVRTRELREACWEEFDLAAAQWRIPASRMKMRDAHIVPLARQSLELLGQLKALNGRQPFVFPNTRTPYAGLSAGTFNQALGRMGLAGKDSIGFTAHGFRSTACTMLNEAGFRPDIIELQLAHQERSRTRAAYNRAIYLDERRCMMQTWADMIDQLREQPRTPGLATPRPAAFHSNSAAVALLMGREEYRRSEITPAIQRLH